MRSNIHDNQSLFTEKLGGSFDIKKSFNSKFQYISVHMITLILNLLINALTFT